MRMNLKKMIRKNVYQWDDFKCRACGWSPEIPSMDKWVKASYSGKRTIKGNSRYLTLDHIIPKSKGGRFVTSNLQTMCNVCNKAKADKMPEGVKI